jgi:hypothetical protein
MATEKKKRAQPSKKRKQQKKDTERMPQRREPGQPAEPQQPDQRVRRRPGQGLDKSDEGVVAGGRLAGRRFTG